MQEQEARSVFARWRRSAWFKAALLALLPVALCGLIVERASWRPRTLPGARPYVFQVAFSPDGKYLAVAAQSVGWVWLEDYGCSGSGCPEDGKFDSAVDVWNARGRTLLRRISAGEEALASIAFSPDGRQLAGLALRREEPPRGDGGTTAKVKVWDVDTGRLARTLRLRGPFARRLVWSGGTLALQNSAQVVSEWDARTGQPLRPPERDRRLPAAPLTFSVDGSLAANSLGCYGTGTHAVEVWDTRGVTLRQTLKNPQATDSLAISPDNSLLATLDEDGSVRLWDVSSGTLLRTLRAEGAKRKLAETLAFSADGSTLATASQGSFMLWRVH